MQFIDKFKEKPIVKKCEKFFPAVAFLAGFGWDSATLGAMVENSDLLFFLAYYLVALILVILLSAHLEHPEGWTKERLAAARAASPARKPAGAATGVAANVTANANLTAPSNSTAATNVAAPATANETAPAPANETAPAPANAAASVNVSAPVTANAASTANAAAVANAAATAPASSADSTAPAPVDLTASAPRPVNSSLSAKLKSAAEAKLKSAADASAAKLKSAADASAAKLKSAADASAAKLKSAAGAAEAKLKNAADASAAKLKNAASASASEMGKFATKMGYESQAIPKNAIVVNHRFLDREWNDVWKFRLSWMLQFCFGSLYSGLVVCYFKSSGSLASLLLVLFLAMLLVGNEFLQKTYERFGISLAFFCLLGTMFLNFTIPYLVHRIGFVWFLLSTLLSFGICVGIQRFSHHKKRVLVAPAVISSVLVVAYVMNWVPPVPLVLKQQLACQNFDRKNFSCDADAPTFLQTIGVKLPSVHRVDSADVYFLSSVYAPAELRAELEYRWYYRNPETGVYTLTDKVSSGRMTLRGGRDAGYRSYTKKKNIPPGRYRVETAYKDGAVIGSQKFEVFAGAPDKGFVRDSLR